METMKRGAAEVILKKHKFVCWTLKVSVSIELTT